MFGMAAVYTCIMNTTPTQCLLFVYEFAGDIYVGSKPMGTKNAQIRIWTNNRCPVGVEKTAQPTVRAMQI